MTHSSSDQSAHLLTHLESGILTITLNRPERRNALSPEMHDLFKQALLDASTDSGVGAVVLTGSGGAFCAGGDVARMAGPGVGALTFEDKVAQLRSKNQVTELLHKMPKPTIAMMSGAAAGAGLSLAMACDIRIADTTSKFTTAFIKVGLPGDFGGHYFLPRLVGAAKARELYMLSPLLTGQEALNIGLIHQLVEPDALQATVKTLAKMFADGPRAAIGHMKANLNYALDASLSDLLDHEAIRHVRCTDTADHKEATQAYVEKRAPRFDQGRSSS